MTNELAQQIEASGMKELLLLTADEITRNADKDEIISLYEAGKESDAIALIKASMEKAVEKFGIFAEIFKTNPEAKEAFTSFVWNSLSEPRF